MATTAATLVRKTKTKRWTGALLLTGYIALYATAIRIPNLPPVGALHFYNFTA